MWGAIRALLVDRLGHGTRAEENEALMDYLVEAQLPLEMCPLSNVSTRVVASLAAHPVRRYVDRGLAVTINTDDPYMFGNSLAEEYRVLSAQFDFSREEIRQVILAGIRASWLPPERQQALVTACITDPTWLAAT